MSPANKGSGYFLSGISDEMKQEYRNRIFDANKNDLQSVANK